jgi:hypothetical protein
MSIQPLTATYIAMPRTLAAANHVGEEGGLSAAKDRMSGENLRLQKGVEDPSGRPRPWLGGDI